MSHWLYNSLLSLKTGEFPLPFPIFMLSFIPQLAGRLVTLIEVQISLSSCDKLGAVKFHSDCIPTLSHLSLFFPPCNPNLYQFNLLKYHMSLNQV
jgi:hypothetical protein